MPWAVESMPSSSPGWNLLPVLARLVFRCNLAHSNEMKTQHMMAEDWPRRGYVAEHVTRRQ